MYTSDMKILSGSLKLMTIIFLFVVLDVFCFSIVLFVSSHSNSGHPFASGFTLSKLAAVTVDEDGNETFDAGVALDKLRKVRTNTNIGLSLLGIGKNSAAPPYYNCVTSSKLR
jgi:hypothetical protein